MRGLWRTCRVARWSGAAAFACLLAVTALSLRWRLGVAHVEAGRTGLMRLVTFQSGAFRYMHAPSSVLPDRRPGWRRYVTRSVSSSSGSEAVWWPRRSGVGGSFLQIAVPLWIPLAVVGVATAGLWSTARWARSRSRAGHCPRCNYDRRGLDPTTPCPECGAVLTAPEAPQRLR